mgnify:CR=1 FL=1
MYIFKCAKQYINTDNIQAGKFPRFNRFSHAIKNLFVSDHNFLIITATFRLMNSFNIELGSIGSLGCSA